MDQLHRRFTVEQVKVLLQGYCHGTLARAEAEELLGIGKTRFFALLQEYRLDPEGFSIAYERETPARLSTHTERAIETELRREQELVEDRRLPISAYNYSATRDRLEQKGITVSATTITARAKQLGCYQPHPKGNAHDREVVTAAIGALVQHDASLHLWSPFASAKWTLITSVDDYSRKLLFADFSSRRRPPGRIFRPPGDSCKPMACPRATLSTTCECSGLCNVATAIGASKSRKRMMWIRSGDRCWCQCQVKKGSAPLLRIPARFREGRYNVSMSVRGRG